MASNRLPPPTAERAVGRDSLGLGAAGPRRSGRRSRERLFPRPIASVEALGALRRAAVGLRRADLALRLSEDPDGHEVPAVLPGHAFAASIKAAAVRLFASCAADLTVLRRRPRGRAAGSTAAEAAALARAATPRRSARAREARRARGAAATRRRPSPPGRSATVWAARRDGEAAFAGSVEDLLRARAGHRGVQGARPSDRAQLDPLPLARRARPAAPAARCGGGRRRLAGAGRRLRPRALFSPPAARPCCPRRVLCIFTRIGQVKKKCIIGISGPSTSGSSWMATAGGPRPAA